MAKKLRKGSAVEVTGGGWAKHWPNRGTVTEVRKNMARVLFPVRQFCWFPKHRLRVVSFDGDGSSVGWR